MEWLSSLVGWSHIAFWLVSVGVPLGLEIGKIQGDQFQNGMSKIFGVDDSDVSFFLFFFQWWCNQLSRMFLNYYVL